MKQYNAPVSPALKRARAALREALARSRPDIVVDDKGYVSSFRENLVRLVALEDFEADLSQGDGNELESKFRAAHSSSALGVNCFAPFRRQMSDLVLPGLTGLVDLQFERKCPTGLRSGKPPNLDVLVSGPAGVVGIESKLTEHLSRHIASFSTAYADQIRDARREPARAGRLLRRRVAEAAAEPLFVVAFSFIGDDAQDGRERKKRAFARCGNRAGGAASIAARGEAWPRVGLASG